MNSIADLPNSSQSIRNQNDAGGTPQQQRQLAALQAVGADSFIEAYPLRATRTLIALDRAGLLSPDQLSSLRRRCIDATGALPTAVSRYTPDGFADIFDDTSARFKAWVVVALSTPEDGVNFSAIRQEASRVGYPYSECLADFLGGASLLTDTGVGSLLAMATLAIGKDLKIAASHVIDIFNRDLPSADRTRVANALSNLRPTMKGAIADGSPTDSELAQRWVAILQPLVTGAEPYPEALACLTTLASLSRQQAVMCSQAIVAVLRSAPNPDDAFATARANAVQQVISWIARGDDDVNEVLEAYAALLGEGSSVELQSAVVDASTKAHRSLRMRTKWLADYERELNGAQAGYAKADKILDSAERECNRIEKVLNPLRMAEARLLNANENLAKHGELLEQKLTGREALLRNMAVISAQAAELEVVRAELDAVIPGGGRLPELEVMFESIHAALLSVAQDAPSRMRRPAQHVAQRTVPPASQRRIVAEQVFAHLRGDAPAAASEAPTHTQHEPIVDSAAVDAAAVLDFKQDVRNLLAFCENREVRLQETLRDRDNEISTLHAAIGESEVEATTRRRVFLEEQKKADLDRVRLTPHGASAHANMQRAQTQLTELKTRSAQSDELVAAEQRVVTETAKVQDLIEALRRKDSRLISPAAEKASFEQLRGRLDKAEKEASQARKTLAAKKAIINETLPKIPRSRENLLVTQRNAARILATAAKYGALETLNFLTYLVDDDLAPIWKALPDATGYQLTGFIKKASEITREQYVKLWERYDKREIAQGERARENAQRWGRAEPSDLLALDRFPEANIFAAAIEMLDRPHDLPLAVEYARTRIKRLYATLAGEILEPARAGIKHWTTVLEAVGAQVTVGGRLAESRDLANVSIKVTNLSAQKLMTLFPIHVINELCAFLPGVAQVPNIHGAFEAPVTPRVYQFVGSNGEIFAPLGIRGVDARRAYAEALLTERLAGRSHQEEGEWDHCVTAANQRYTDDTAYAIAFDVNTPAAWESLSRLKPEHQLARLTNITQSGVTVQSWQSTGLLTFSGTLIYCRTDDLETYLNSLRVMGFRVLNKVTSAQQVVLTVAGVFDESAAHRLREEQAAAAQRAAEPVKVGMPLEKAQEIAKVLKDNSAEVKKSGKGLIVYAVIVNALKDAPAGDIAAYLRRLQPTINSFNYKVFDKEKLKKALISQLGS